MKYLNQLEYEQVPYPTDTDHPDSDFCTAGTVKRAGCGLCAVCMVVDHLTLETGFGLEECRLFSMEIGANHGVGTDMKILAPAVAERFDLDLDTTDDPEELAACLQAGGAAVIHVGGDREGHTGIFSRGGHYMAAVGVRNGMFCILDPSWTEEKYLQGHNRDRVRQSGVWLYADGQTLQEDTANRSPGYYLFTRRSDRG